MINIRQLEADLWESADLLRAGSKLTSSQYCMPVLALLFLRYAYSRFKMVEAELLKNRPSRGGRMIPVEANDFAAKSALFLALSEHAKKHDNAAWRDKEMTFEKALGILDSEEAMYKHSIKEQQATLKATRGKKEKDEIKAVIAANEAELALTLDTKNMGTKLSG